MTPGKAFQKALKTKGPLLLPAAHDGLTARLIEHGGFKALQVGGFASVGARYGEPDIDFHHLDDRLTTLRLVTGATSLPALVDCDDGYGDVKNVAYAVEKIYRAGAAGLFIEDQKPPKRCGQIGVKEVIPLDQAVRKLRVAHRARQGTDFFLIGRTDALATTGVEEVIARAKAFADAGCDAVYVEGIHDDEQLERIGEALRDLTLCTTMMSGGGKLSWHDPDDFHDRGYKVLFYPTAILFAMCRAAREALEDLSEGENVQGITLEEFEILTGLPRWAEIEKAR